MTTVAPARRRIAPATPLVRDCDKAAIVWYTHAPGFALPEDTGPGGAGKTALLLAPPGDAARRARIGHRTGGRVDHFRYTDDSRRGHAAMSVRGGEFPGTPRREPCATVAGFRGRYDGKWDLLEATP